MKKYAILILLLAFIIPSVVFASWWNPFSWGIFNKKISQSSSISSDKTIITSNINKDQSDEIESLKKELEELKKQQNFQSKPNEQQLHEEVVVNKNIADKDYKSEKDSLNLAEKALLENLRKQDNNIYLEQINRFNDAWRENPSQNCSNNPGIDYSTAKFLFESVEKKMLDTYGESLNWTGMMNSIYDGWCLGQ